VSREFEPERLNGSVVILSEYRLNCPGIGDLCNMPHQQLIIARRSTLLYVTLCRGTVYNIIYNCSLKIDQIQLIQYDLVIKCASNTDVRKGSNQRGSSMLPETLPYFYTIPAKA